MSKDNVDVGVVKSLQRALQPLDNVLLRQTPTHWLAKKQHGMGSTCLVLGSCLRVPKNICQSDMSV